MLPVLGGELGSERAVVEVRFGGRGGGIALAGARCGDRLRQGHPEVDVVEQDLQHRGDDGRAARRADGEIGHAVLQHDRGAHARTRPLARCGQVRIVGAGRCRREVEVGHLVVEQEAAAGNGDAAAGELFDGVGVADDVAPLVGDDEVVGLGALVHRVAGHGRGRACRVRRERRSGCDRRGQRGGADEAATGGRERGVEQAVLRHRFVVGVADVGVAVGEGEPAGLEVVEQRRRPRLGGEIKAGQDVQRLAGGDPAARRRRHPVDVQTPVGDVGRLAVLGGVVGHVAGGHDAGAHRQRGARPDRRVLHGLRDLRAERAAVEIGRAVRSDLLVGAGEVRVSQGRADRQRLPVGGEEELAAAGEGLQVRQRRLLLLDEVRRDREALLGDLDGGLKVGAEAAPAVVAHRLGPGGDHARYADRQPGVPRLLERERLAGTRVDEQLWRARGGTHLASVDGDDLMRPRQVDDHETAAAGSGDEWLGDPERARNRHRSVDGVATGAQHVDAGLAGVELGRGDRAAGAGGHRLLHVVRWAVRRCLRRCNRCAQRDGGDDGDGPERSHEIPHK